MKKKPFDRLERTSRDGGDFSNKLKHGSYEDGKGSKMEAGKTDRGKIEVQKLNEEKVFIEKRAEGGGPDKIDELIKTQVEYKVFNDKDGRKFLKFYSIGEIEGANPGIMLIRLAKMEGAEYFKLGDSVLHSPNGGVLFSALTENHPIVSILRTRVLDNVVSITYTSLKRVNDEIHTKAGDLSKDAFYAIQKENLEKYLSNNPEYNVRLLSRDHKDTARAAPKEIEIGNIVEILFGDLKTKEQVAEAVVNRIKSQDIVEITKETGWSEDKIRKEIKDRFNFGINYSVNGKGDRSKIFTHRDAVTGAKPGGFETGEIILHNVGPKQVLKNINSHFKLEKKIIEQFKGQRFAHSGVSYDIVVTNPHSGELELSPILIQDIRKGKIIDNPVGLGDMVSESSNILNNTIDYIPPYIGNLDKGIKEANRISDNFENGIIELSDLEKNYKGYLGKAQYYEKIRGSDGLKASIDIIGMGGDNRADFRQVAREYKRLMKKYRETGKLKFKSKAYEVLLSAGMSVTDRVLDVAEGLKKKYPNVDVRLGGDEFWFHNPEIKKGDEESLNQFLVDVNKLLEKNGFKGRMTYSFDKRDPVAIYDKLDNQGKISKGIEGIIEQFIYGDSKENDNILRFYGILNVHNIKPPNSIVIKVSDSIVHDKGVYPMLLEQKNLNWIFREQHGGGPVAAILNSLKFGVSRELNLTVGGKSIKVNIQKTKVGLIFSFT